MTKKLTASKMPRLRDALQDQCAKFSATDWEPAFATFSQTDRAIAKKVRAIDLQDATLWWVRPDMARLAWDAAQTLPENTRLLEAVPAPKGIIIWEGDPLLSGLLVVRTGRGQQTLRPIHGAVWEVTSRGVEIATLIHEPPESPEIRYIPLYSYQYIGQLKKDLEAYLTATFLLATQPRIGQITRHDPTPRRRRTVSGRHGIDGAC